MIHYYLASKLSLARNPSLAFKKCYISRRLQKEPLSKKPKFKQAILLSVLSLALSGCAETTKYADTSSLAGLQRLGRAPVAGKNVVKISAIRLTALEDTALSTGAQAGLAWRAKQINAELASRTNELDETYNFYGILLAHDVLPPVLEEADDSLNLADPSTIRLAAKTYKIVSQARFVTAPPTWRDYLWMNYQAPEAPSITLLPRNSTEQKVWDHYVNQGWNNGIHQADNIMAANLARINRDYKGMILYRKLYAENMVSAPYVARTNLGITGDASHMNINDQVLRITALPELNLRGNTWKPGIIPENGTVFKSTIKQRKPNRKFKHKHAKIHITNDSSWNK